MRLSVIMSNYNHARYLNNSLGSLAFQTRKADEVIIVDDGSTDDSLDVIQWWAERNKEFNVIKLKRNEGPLNAGKHALLVASGDYIMLAAADDWWKPTLFEDSLRLLSLYPQAGMCYSDCLTEYEDSYKCSNDKKFRGVEYGYISPKDLVQICKKRTTYLSAQGAIIKRSAFNEVGMLPQLIWSGDHVMTTIITLRYGVCYIPKTLYVNRARSSSFGSEGLKSLKHRDIIELSLDLFDSRKYSDIKDLVIDSAILASFKLPLLHVIFKRRYLKFLTIRLLFNIFKNYIKDIISKVNMRRKYGEW